MGMDNSSYNKEFIFVIAMMMDEEDIYQSTCKIPSNSAESVPNELQAPHIKLPGAIKLGFMISASANELSCGSGPLAE